MIRNYLEIVERGYTGPLVSREDWDLDHIAAKAREMVEKYNLTWDKSVITPDDRELAKRIFHAGREFLIQTGVYNISTGRVIKLSEDEIDEALANNPKTLAMGEGKDIRYLYARNPEDSRKPIVWAGNPGVPTPETLFKPSVKSWAQEPVVDLITCGSLVDIDGFTVRSREPSELIAVKRELQYLREVLKQVGRPGMGMLAAESSVSEVGDLSVAHPDYLRPCDSHLVALFNELIIDRDNMVRAANSLEYGMRNASLACVMVGGMAGGAPGAAVVMVASMLAANIVCRADYHLCHPIHIRHTATSTRECMWLQSVVCQAFAECAPSIIVCDIYPKSGAMTMELLYEVAANALAITVSGGHLEGVGSSDGLRPNGTGLEARLMGEIGVAASRQGLKRSEANELIQNLLGRYEHVFALEEGNPGLPFEEAYDMVRVQPKPEWLAMYEKVKLELKDFGLSI